jgi:tetratricopeptide (TPR) repeat protein
MLYSRPSFFQIDGNKRPQISDEILASSEMQVKLELKYMLYETEVDQLIKIIQSKNSRPILISTPLNYLTPPKIACANSSSTTIENKLNKIKSLFNKGDYKSAYTIASNLVQVATGNAKALYWFGKLLKYTGNNQEAFKMLKAASALDCSSWRGSSIFNVIMSKKAKKYGARFIDFDKIIHQNYWKNTLFLDEIYPQDIEYQKISTTIAKQINEIIKN